MAKLITAGNIYTVDNPKALGSDDEVHESVMALLIEFESVDELQEAMTNGQCKFKTFGG